VPLLPAPFAARLRQAFSPAGQLAAQLTMRRPRPRGALVASAAVISPQEGVKLAKQSRSRQWQRASFGYARALPEVGFALRFLANNSTHIRLFVGDRPPGADEVDELNDAYGWLDEERSQRDPDALPDDLIEAAQQALDLLTGASPSGGGAAILAPLVRNYETVGECYLVGRYDRAANEGRGEETWGVYSISEVKFEEGKLPGTPATLDDGLTPFPRGYFRLVTGEGRQAEAINLDPTTTTVVRLWTADAEWSAEPDSPMRSLVGVCERLILIERGDDASLRSRAAGNGVLLWPEELDPIPDDEDDEEDEFDRDFVTQITTPLTLDGSAAQVVPMIKRGAYQYLDRIRHLTFARPLDPVVHEREARLLARLGIGLDVPPEVITGLADTNHWNAWQITSDLFRHHQEPITIASVEALSLGYLRARLTAAKKWDPELIRRLVIWYDASNLVAPADMTAAANDAHDRGLITDEGYRALRGIDESYAPPTDTPTGTDPVGETGLAPDRLAAIAGIARELLAAGYEPDAVTTALGLDIAHTGLVPVNFRSEDALAQAGVPGISGDVPGGQPTPPKLPPGSEPAPETPPETPPAIEAPPEAPPPAAGSPTGNATDLSRRLSRRLATIERTLRERIAAAADAALQRALERAGNRARAAAQGDPQTREAVAGQPPENVLASLGQTVVAALGLEEQQLLADAFAKLRENYVDWSLTAAEEAIDAAAQLAGLDRTDPDVQRYIANLRDRFAENVDASWPTLETGLNDLAAERLYNPNPNVPEVGELPAGAVPPGLVREALAVAGGLDPAADGRPPLSGLTSGRLLDGFLRDAGTEVVEYEWAYGISARPFHPHRRLDGRVFAGFDDPALSSAGTGGEWVGGSFAPGDHKGCHCDYVPIYSDGRDTRADMERISRTAHVEQYPDRPLPVRQATVDEKVYRPERIRPEQVRTPAAQAAQEARNAPPAPAPAPQAPQHLVPAPVITSEQYEALLPRRGGWTTSTRNKTVAVLKTTPEGRGLLKTLDSFQSGASSAIPRFRTDMQKVLDGDESVPPGRRDTVHNLLNAIHHSDAGERPLYRGMVIPGSPEEVLARYAPGSRQDLMLSSFSTDKKLATDFSIKGAGQAIKRSGPKTGVVVEWTNGPKHALPIENLGKSSVFANEREWVAAGRYRVTGSKVAKRGGRDVVVVQIEQEGVWGPGGQVLTAAGLPPDLNVDEYLSTMFRELDPTGEVARSLTDGADEPADDEE
jgi:hypothetical protein